MGQFNLMNNISIFTVLLVRVIIMKLLCDVKGFGWGVIAFRLQFCGNCVAGFAAEIK